MHQHRTRRYELCTRRDGMEHVGQSAAGGRGTASMVTHPVVGSTRVTLREGGTKDSRVKDTGGTARKVEPCLCVIHPRRTSPTARKVRENPDYAGDDRGAVTPCHARASGRVRCNNGTHRWRRTGWSHLPSSCSSRRRAAIQRDLPSTTMETT